MIRPKTPDEAEPDLSLRVAANAISSIQTTGHVLQAGVKTAASGIEEAYFQSKEMMELLTYDGKDDLFASNNATSFFRNLQDNESEPIIVEEQNTSHVDLVWRKLGLIRQIGEFRGLPAYYNARCKQWRYQDGDEDIPSAQIPRGEASIKNRADDVPRAILYVVSGHEETQHRPDTESKLEDKETQSAVKKNLESITRAAQAHKQHDEKYMDEEDFSRNLQQFLSRAIPNSAKKAQGIIVTTPGQGYIAQNLARGVKNARESRTGHAGIVEKVQVALLGITAFPGHETNPKDFLDMNFTHHVVLRRSTVCRRQACFTAGKIPICKGWAPQGESQGPAQMTCKSCGHPRSDHIAPSVLNSYKRRKKTAMSDLAVPDELEPTPDESPLPLEVNQYVAAMVEYLSSGHNPGLELRHRTARRPPHRDTVPVVTILFGGDYTTTPFRLMQCVNRRWTIIIIEGSGGYADLLCKVITRVRSVAPAAGVDEFRALCTALEPLTSEIVNSSLWHIIPRGTKAEELSRCIESALKGNEALAKAWVTYATWERNANNQKILYKNYQMSLLICSITTTLATVIVTFVLVRWNEEGIQPPPTLPDGPGPLGMIATVFWSILLWSVIVLPIVMSLLQVLSNKGNHGAKFVYLLTSSERLLSEIYKYRTRTNDYREEEIKRHSKPTTEKVIGWEVYQTREALLQLRIKKLMDALLETEVSTVTMEDSLGPVPPHTITSTGDDGFSDLSPDQYIRYRVEESIEKFKTLSQIQSTYLRLVQYSIHTFSALGTILAAIAAYGAGSAQAWVCFTTAMMNALTRFLDYSRWEWKVQKQNSVIADLKNVSIWWVSLGPKKDNHANRESLVDHVEAIILDLIDSWGKQLQSAMEKQKKEGNKIHNETAAMLKKVEKGEDLDQVRALKELDLTPDKLADCLTDPTSASAAQVLLVIKDLSTKLGIKMEIEKKDMTPLVEKAKKDFEAARDEAKKAGDAVSAIDQATFGGMGQTDCVPDDIMWDFVKDRESRRKFFMKLHEKMKNYSHSQLSINDIFLAAEEASPQSKKITTSGYGNRQIFEIVKAIALEEIMSKFCEVRLPDNTLMTMDMFVDKSEDIEEFVSDMRVLCRNPILKEMTLESISGLMQSATVKKKMFCLGALNPSNQHIIRRILDCGEKIFKPSDSTVSWQLNDLLKTALAEISVLDVEELLSSKENRISLWQWQSSHQVVPLNVSFLNKAELLVLFPPSISKRIEGKSQMQISHYYDEIMFGTEASHVMMAFTDKYSNVLPKELKQSRDLQERFAICSEMLSQNEINGGNISSIILKMKASPSYVKEIGKIVQDMDDPKVILSIMQSSFSNTYAARIVDRAADLNGCIDVRAIFSIENRSQFVSKLRLFKHLIVNDRVNVTKSRILQLIGSKSLVHKLDMLNDKTLNHLISRTCLVETCSWEKSFFMKSAHKAQSIFNNATKPLEDHIIPHLLCAAEYLDEHDLNNLSEGADLLTMSLRGLGSAAHGTGVLGVSSDDIQTKLLTRLADPVLFRILQRIPVSDIVEMMWEIKSVVGDYVLLDIIASVCQSLQDEDFENLFFKSANLRAEFCALMIKLSKLSLKQFKNLDREKVIKEIDHASELYEAFTKIDPKIVIRSCSLMLQSLRTQIPLKIFHKLSLCTPHFDLREMICDVQDRELLLPLVMSLVMSDEPSTQDVISFMKPVYVQTVLEETFFERNFPQRHHTTRDSSEVKPNAWFDDCIDACVMCGVDFAGVVNELRLFTEPQLRFVIAKVIMLLETPVGKFFEAEQRKNSKENDKYLGVQLRPGLTLTMGQRVFLDHMLQDLQNELLSDSARVLTRLENFDVKKFMKQTPIERLNALNFVVPNSPDIAKQIFVDDFSDSKYAESEYMMEAYFNACSKYVIRESAPPLTLKSTGTLRRGGREKGSNEK